MTTTVLKLFYFIVHEIFQIIFFLLLLWKSLLFLLIFLDAANIATKENLKVANTHIKRLLKATGNFKKFAKSCHLGDFQKNFNIGISGF